MSKRQKLVLTSIALSLGFIGIGLLENEQRFIGIAGLTLMSLVLFTWSLFDGLGKNATLLVLVLPTMFTLGVGIFWFLLPSTLFTRLPVVVMYGLGLYALGLTANIFIVSSVRTIALVRAAKSVGFVLTLFTFFLLFDVILSIKAGLLINLLLSFIVSVPLFLQGSWASRLEHKLTIDIIKNSLILSYSMTTIVGILHFWPVTVIVGSLFLTVCMYVLLGISQAQIEGRLFRKTAREYLVIGLLVFFAVLVVTSWRG